MTFVDLADGGRQLAALLSPDVRGDALLVCIGAGGQVTGRAVAEALGAEVVPVPTARDDSGVRVDLSALQIAGRDVVVIDDGVESGTAAIAAGAAIRGAGATRVVLAVPVCPRDAEPALRREYDDVIAVTKPLERISLHEHYDTFA
ncbi:MAG TPA: phosphoribosyltransferase family protein [Candidatus Nanopelagicales bacterium]|nr:phosphoribosyltransferase family protein [Candidatus Nanopelagicales bacterium]